MAMFEQIGCSRMRGNLLTLSMVKEIIFVDRMCSQGRPMATFSRNKKTFIPKGLKSKSQV